MRKNTMKHQIKRKILIALLFFASPFLLIYAFFYGLNELKRAYNLYRDLFGELINGY